MILVDSNLPMYLVGAAHPHKAAARSLVESAVARQVPLVTDAEVLQEILHRYHAIKRPAAIQAAFDVVLGVVDRVLPIDLDAVQRAKEIMTTNDALSARDALHVAVIEAHGVGQMMSFDAGFDQLPGVTGSR